MEWLTLILSWILVVIKWISVVIIFLIVIVLFIAALFFEIVMARDEKKMYEGKDPGWKLFRLIAIVLGILACIFAFMGYLIIGKRSSWTLF